MSGVRMYYTNYFKKMIRNADVKKIVDEFFRKHKNEIVRWWLNNYKLCELEDYSTADCDEYLVSGDIARDIVQPLYDYVEKIENEIKARLFQLFITLRPRCSNCRYFIPYNDPRIRHYTNEELAHDEGYCVLHHRIVSDDELCKKYEPTENIEVDE